MKMFTVTDDEGQIKFETDSYKRALRAWKLGASVEYTDNGEPVFGAGHYLGEDTE